MIPKDRLSNKSILAIIVVVVFLGAILYLKFREINLPTADLKIGDVTLKVEIAETPFSWQKGLSGRDSLSENNGMLFTFVVADRQAIWMKDMKFPIDIIWLENGKIVDMAQNIKPTIIEPLPVYLPRLPAKFVLEVNAGIAQKYGWKIGDSVILLTK